MSSTESGPLNIVYIHSHDTGRYVQPYGYAVSTPNIQQLAEEGVLFRKAFAAAPTYSPSRAALLTGQAPHTAGMLGLAHRGFRLNDPDQHLSKVLTDAGYATTLVGVQHVARDASELAYAQVLSQDKRSVASVAPAACAVLREHRSSEQQRPFFLDIGFSETHRVYPEPGADDDPRYIAPPTPMPDTMATRGDMAAYHTSARELDRGVGMVLDTLRSTGFERSTLVTSTTDHGLAFPIMKCNLTTHGTGVMLILRCPGKLPADEVIDGLVSHIDVFPTVCELIGINSPSWVQGRSLMPLINGSTDSINDAVFSEVTFHAAYEPQRSVRTDRWNYIRRFGSRTTPVLSNVDDGPSRDLWYESGWPERELAREQLYDLIVDPAETNNLAGDTRYSTTFQGLRERLDDWMKRTADPLLSGDIPLPVGASANDPNSRSFSEPLMRATTDGKIERIKNFNMNG